MTHTTGDVQTTVTLTDDVQPQWLNVIRRLQAACHGNQGLAILSINVLVNADGKPMQWSEPKRTKLEPKSESGVVMELLAGMVQ